MDNFSVCDNTKLRYIVFEGGRVQEITNLNDKNLLSPFRYTKVSYWFLMKLFWMRICNSKKEYRIQKIKHTSFRNNELPNLSLKETKQMKEYILWFQFVINRMDNILKYKKKDNIIFFIELLTSKVWTSIRALAGTALVINLIFSVIYYYSGAIPILWHSALKSFYFSIVSFTTLGFGDISPHSQIGEILVIFQVSLGYITLGALVFLIGRIVDRKY